VKQYEQTYKSAMVEDNVYSWSVFFAILAMPAVAVGNHIWKDIQKYLKQRDKEARMRAEALVRMEELKNPTPKPAKEKVAPRIDKRYQEQLETARELQRAADEEYTRNLGRGIATSPDTSEETEQDRSEYKEGPWNETEISNLAKALKKYPGGTLDRWIKISKMVITRDAKAVMAQVANMKKRGAAVDKAPAWEANVPQKEEPKAPVVAPWDPEQQKQLEAAIKKHPNVAGASATDRWASISGEVEGKTKKECIARYKEIVQLLKKKQSQTA